MAWTAPRTWVTGETVTAALLNTHLRDNLNAIGVATSYTAAVSGTGWAIGNGTRSAYYIDAGQLTIAVAQITWGSTSTFGGSALDITGHPQAQQPVESAARFNDTGTAIYGGYWEISGTDGFPLAVNASATYTTLSSVINTIPHTWASTDVLFLCASYIST